MAAGAAGDLTELGGGKLAILVAVVFAVGGEGDMVEVEIEAHADGVGRHQEIDVAAPMIFAGLSVALNVALALTLFPVIAEAGIATAESSSGWLNAALLLFTLRRREHFTFDAAFLRVLPRLILCSALMGVAVYYGLWLLQPYFAADASTLAQVGALLLVIGAGGLIYFVAAEASGAANIRELLRNMRRQPPPEVPPAHSLHEGRRLSRHFVEAFLDRP